MNPEPLTSPTGVASPAVVATGSRTVYVSGQVALDKDGKLVGEGDLEAQAKQAYANVREVLATVGATVADIVKLTIYVVGYRPEHRMMLRAVRVDFLEGGQPPAATVVGVQALSRPGFLIEVEAVAILE